jgi:hypothetical protein
MAQMIALTKEQAQAMVGFLSKTLTNRSIDGVAFIGDKAYATDTYILAEFTLGADNCGDVIVPKTALETIIKSISKGQYLTISHEKDEKWRIYGGGAVVEFTPMADYPPAAALIETMLIEELTPQTLKVSLLKTALANVEKWAGKNTRIEIKHMSRTTAMVVTADNIRALIMPVRG